MFKQTILAAAIGLSALSGAFAQVQSPRSIDDPVAMKPFYTDDKMTTLRTPEEIDAAIKAMKSEDKAKVETECMNVDSPRASFCDAFNTANKK